MSLFAQQSERVRHGIALKNLTPDVALATCFKWLPVGDIPANQIYIQTQQGGLLSGVPWDIAQATRLRKQIRKAGGKSIRYMVLTELNEDRLPVIAYYKRKGIQLIADTLTARQLSEFDIQADVLIASDTTLLIGKRVINLFPTGKGFSESGLAVFLPDCRMLYAGYFVASPTAKYPAIHPKTSVKDWGGNLEKLYFRFSDVRHVIPGQGMPGNSNLIRRSILLVNEIHRQQERHSNNKPNESNY